MTVPKTEISKDVWIAEVREMMEAYVEAWDQCDDPQEFMQQMVAMRIACRYFLEKLVPV